MDRSMMNKSWLGIALLALGYCGAPPPAVDSRQSASTTTALTYTLPASGMWSITMYSGIFGDTASCNASGDLSTSDFDEISQVWCNAGSYVLCNNTGSTHTFRVNLYSYVGYSQLLRSDASRVLNGSCFVANAPGAISSVTATY
jgi:hypothetical protein